MEVVSVLFGAIASFISGTALLFMKRIYNKKIEKDKVNEEKKSKESILILKSINVLGELTRANTIAIRDGKTNGETREALEKYDELSGEFYEYLLEQNSRQ